MAASAEASGGPASLPGLQPDGGQLLVQPGRRTIFVREAEWKTGARLEPYQLTSGWRRRRDRELCLLATLGDHRYLTTEQIQALFFPSLRSAQQHLHRMAADLQLLMRWLQLEPVVDPKAPVAIIRGWRRRSSLVLLTEHGATVLATFRRLDPKEQVRRSWYAEQYAYHLEHHLGTNSFWVSLAAAARDLPDQGLYHWVGDDSMRRAHQEMGVDLAPDGWGRYLTGDREVLFSLEWDSGTEPPQRLSRKARGHLDHHAGRSSGGLNHVLVVLPGPKREASIRDAIGRAVSGSGQAVRFWTTTAQMLRDRGPLGAVWSEAAVAAGPRLPLVDLPGLPRSTRSISDCIGKPSWWERRPWGRRRGLTSDRGAARQRLPWRSRAQLNP